MPVINLYIASIDANFDSTKGFFSDTLYFFGHPVFFRTRCIARKRKSAKFCSYGFHGQISKCHFCPWKLWHSKLEKSQTWSSYILYYKINQTRKNIWKNVYILHWLVTIPMPKDTGQSYPKKYAQLYAMGYKDEAYFIFHCCIPDILDKLPLRSFWTSFRDQKYSFC